jgi:LysM repeat protein
VTTNAPTNTLIGIISTCGHRDLDVMDEVLELNGLADASALSLGQVIEVPRPTPTTDPNQALTAEAGDGDTETSSSGGSSFSSVLFADGADGLPTFTPTVPPTLPPGIQWHTVVKDETIISVVNRYGAGVEVLSQINPEMTFSQCEFNADMPYGGPSCTVMLFEGMRMRVPAPTPTPTLSPTPSGSETPTPSPSPTFNAPNLVSPGNRVLFTRGELVTLRWRGTGTLAPDDVYRVTVRNLETGITYETTTRDTALILPREWQERDGSRYNYEWQVSVVNQNTPDTPRFFTETRIFTWEAAEAEGE